jgi:hypothetical protein
VVQTLRAQGKGIKSIMRELGLAKETVRRFARADSAEELLAKARGRQPSVLDEFKLYVNRIKMIKRQMYGRASFDLLPQTRHPGRLTRVVSITKCRPDPGLLPLLANEIKCWSRSLPQLRAA